MSAQVLDLNVYYGRLARNEPISPDEIADLLKMAAHFQGAAAYLASCHAATAEGLPASASRSAKDRMASICRTGERLLAGDTTGMRLPASPEAARCRCRGTAERLEAEITVADADKAAKKVTKKTLAQASTNSA